VLVRRGRDGDAVGIEITDSILRTDDETEGFLGIGILEDRPGRPAITKGQQERSYIVCQNREKVQQWLVLVEVGKAIICDPDVTFLTRSSSSSSDYHGTLKSPECGQIN